MSGYNIEYFISDFIKRTDVNLQLIKQFKKDSNEKKENVYEVTALINSLFGLIIVPFERYKDVYNSRLEKSNSSEMEELREFISGLMISDRYYSNYKEKTKVREFIRHIRNSLAHSGNSRLLFYPIAERGEIDSVIFYDTGEENGITKEFCVKLTIDEIKELARLISNLYSSYQMKSDKTIAEDYEKQVNYCTKLFDKWYEENKKYKVKRDQLKRNG